MRSSLLVHIFPSRLARHRRRETLPELATNADVAQVLGEINVPTLLLYAAKDHIIPPGMALLAARAMPGAKLVLFQHHSHSPASEAPRRLVDEVVLFMNEVGPDSFRHMS